MASSGEATRRKSQMVNRISSLPIDLIRKVLCFLPSREAVLASFVAREWRDQWKDLRTLRAMDSKGFDNANELNEFVNYFLLLREPVALDEVAIRSYDHCWDFEVTFLYIEQWVRYAILRKVKALRLCIMLEDIMDEEDNIVHWALPDKLLTSNTLVKLELTRVESWYPSLNFSSCPLLTDVKMKFCDLHINRLTAPSITHLSITYCCFVSDRRTRISAPNLVSLQLVDCRERTPLLGSMPKLVSAIVRLRYCSDYCAKNYEIGDCGDDSCEGCPGIITGNSPNILLEALSFAANLELTAHTNVFIFRRDLTHCPVFSKLKTLLLNDWCLIRNLDALVCFLQHSPALEKLILQLPEIPEDLVIKVGIYDVKEQPLMEHLTVEVKCNVHDERIHQIVEVLRLYGLSSEKIKTSELPKQIISCSWDLWPPGSRMATNDDHSSKPVG